jgi:hypothetical protein
MSRYATERIHQDVMYDVRTDEVDAIYRLMKTRGKQRRELIRRLVTECRGLRKQIGIREVPKVRKIRRAS